jgi:type I site-specific restriction endonuclease
MIDSEYNTRRNRIDVLIQEAGWDIHKASQVILEVDTFQSSNSEVRKYTVSNTSYISDMLMGTLKDPS